MSIRWNPLTSVAPWVLALIPLACDTGNDGSLAERVDEITDAPEADAPSPVDEFAARPTTMEDGGAPGDAHIRVVHGSADAPPVDIYVEGLPGAVITDLSYAQATGYLALPPGDYNFQIRAAGADPMSPPVYETGLLGLPAGASVTALAAGLLGSADPADMFRVVPLVETFSAPGANESVVRIVHASADAPAVDLDVGDDGSTEIAGLARFADTGGAGVPLPANTGLQVGIVAGGQRVTGFTMPPLGDGQEYLVIATGLVGSLPRQNDGFNLLVVGSGGGTRMIRQNPVVHALHASPDAPAVDICAGGALLLDDVAFGDIGRIQVPPGEYTLDIHGAAGSCAGAPVASPPTPMLEAGQQYLAVATGELTPEAGDPGFSLQAYPETFYTGSPSAAVLDIIHGASAPAVDIGVVLGGQIPSGAILASDLAWPENSSQVRVPAGLYPVGVAGAGGMPPLAPLATFDVPATAGFRGWIFAAGALAPAPGEEPFRLLAIDTTVAPWGVTEILPN